MMSAYLHIYSVLIHHMDEFMNQAANVINVDTIKFCQIPMGVLLSDENKLDEMRLILDHYMELVPTVEAEGHLILPKWQHDRL